MIADRLARRARARTQDASYAASVAPYWDPEVARLRERARNAWSRYDAWMRLTGPWRRA